ASDDAASYKPWHAAQRSLLLSVSAWRGIRTASANVRSMRTKSELLAALEASRDEVVAGLDGLDLSAGVYEGGWNGRQVLAHIASMEWTYPRILELPAATDEEAARPRDTSVTVDDYNRRQVER